MKYLILLIALAILTPDVDVVAEEFGPLFNGKSLNGWMSTPGGDWKVKNGVIIGTSEKSESRHGILLSDRKYKDFVVKGKFRVMKGDSGFYFRAERVQSSVSVHGFQVEIDTSQETGGLYETGGRGWVKQPSVDVIKQRKYEPGQWTDLELSAVGKDVIVKINGVVSAKLENDKGRREGHFGLQLHGGQDMHVEFRDLVLAEVNEE
ncbi:MAG: DUF1080 domain-containing protein [Planctomycetaceae bacterium]|nr:DUF1080 domain-containing protein [Planctomycetaceae bacterium]